MIFKRRARSPGYLSRGNGRLEMRAARVRRGNHRAHGFLVEALEPAVTFEIFEVAADSAFAQELIVLGLCNQSGRQQPLEASWLNRPALPFGEGLTQKLEVRKRFHGVDATLLELIAQAIEVKPRFQVMHSRLQEALSVQANPKTDCA